ncbi:MAG TPA: BatA domain-containing protein [Pyrinomonadaceae bacterium]|jgi:hypothetical protein|nr:BatA domain-containing protein [Pyrinomonadaceae bacterium]
MSLLSPLFLLGLAAIAAPVLVHLVRRTRARRVEFPALVFVRQVPQRTIRRRTLHNLLLLLLRCLALLLVVFAFTRPFFSGSGSAKESERERATLVLLDRSLSMRHAGHFDEALARARALVEDAREGERVAVMTFAEGHEVVNNFTADKNEARAALARLAPGYEATDYEQGLRGAETLFDSLKDAGAKRVFLVSDFQAAGWDAARASFKLRPDVRLALVDVGGDPKANAGVTNVEARGAVYGKKYEDKLAVHVSNFADEPRERVTIELIINEQTAERREINLAARDTKTVEFAGFNLAEGPNRCSVRLKTDDFAADNEFYFTLRREAPAKALIVDAAGRGRGESFYLLNALATDENLPFAFDVKAPGAVDPAGLSNSSLVILNDAGAAPGALADGLSRFVEAGGRLVIAAGPRTRPESFNQSLGRIAPATLKETVQLRRGETVAMTDVKMDHPVFEVFGSGGRLAAARVFGYQRAEPREGSTVLARFEDGSPALVESGANTKGRVLLFTSSLGMSWSDLPLTPLYLPLVQQLVRHLGEREVSAWHRLGQTFTVAKDAEGATPPVDTPTGERLKAGGTTPEGDLLVTAREPGFYRLRYGAGHDFAAVNVDGREGDFSKLNTEEFLAAVTDPNPSVLPADATGAREDAAETEARQRVWWPLLLAALLLFAAEAWMARRIKVAKMIG